MGHLDTERSNENMPSAEQNQAEAEAPRAGEASREMLLRERDMLLAEVEELQAKLERYHAHAQRTSRMFLSVTSYAEWVKENARRDAELTLRKARARADKTLGSLKRERERSERELLRLQALSAETRTRLSTFTTAALQILNAEVEAGQVDDSTAGLGDIQDTLRRELASASQPAPPASAGAERPAR